MRVRIVRDRKSGTGYTLMGVSGFKWRRQRTYYCWFASRGEAAKYLAAR
jgi:hypothetical protein